MRAFFGIAALTLAFLPQMSRAQDLHELSVVPTQQEQGGYYASLSDTDDSSVLESPTDQAIYGHAEEEDADLVHDEGVSVDTLMDSSPLSAVPSDFGYEEYPDAACSSCDTGGCDGSGMHCGTSCCNACPVCCGTGRHCTSVYGSFLYLRARNADVAYGVPMDGPVIPPPLTGPVQLGGVGVVDQDYQPGFRAGLNVALDTCSSLNVHYTFFESNSFDEISTSAPQVIRSLVSHPSTASAANDFLSAHGQLDINFDSIDATYRHVLTQRELWAANYVLGARYANLEQQFEANFFNGGTETVATDIDFDGAGILIGLETERHSCHHRLHVYANGSASFLAGRFRANYFQGQSFDPIVVNTDWEAGRIVPVLDLELGVGWTSQKGRLRLRGGYLVSAWYNTLKTQDFIHAVQGSDFVNLGDTLTFDGLNARVEYRF